MVNLKIDSVSSTILHIILTDIHQEIVYNLDDRGGEDGKFCLTNNQQTLLRRFIERNLKVKRSWTLPDSSAGVIMTSVARTIVSSKFSSVGDGDTSEMGADSEDDQPLGVLHTLAVVLGVSQGGWVHGNTVLNLLGCSVTNKQGLASPLECHVLAFWDISQLDFNLGQSQN